MLTSARQRRLLAIVGLVMTMVLAACTGDDDDAAGETSTSSTTTTTSTTSTTTEPPDPTVEAAAVWAQAWEKAAVLGATPGDLAAVTSPEVAERLLATLQPPEGTDPDPGFDGRSVTSSAKVTADGNGTFSVDDCLLIDPQAGPSPSVWYKGTVEARDGNLIVSAVEPEVLTGCVPEKTASEVLAAWDVFWEHFRNGTTRGQEFRAMTTGDYRAFSISAQAEDDANGVMFRDFDTKHPIIVEFIPGRVRVASCSDASPKSGLYELDDPDTPVRLDTSGAAHNADDITFVLEEGKWKVASVAASFNVDCDPNSREGALPTV